MKKGPVVTYVCLLIFCLLATPVATRAEIYIEGYLGGGGVDASAPAIETGGVSSPSVLASPAPPTFVFAPRGTPESFVATGTVSTFDNSVGLKSDPFIIGGLKLGTWFDGRPFPCNPPDWMKYFGVYLDLGFQNFDFGNSNGVSTIAQNTTASGGGLFLGSAQNEFSSSGFAFTAALMFSARYGFMPDKEVPFGRLQPYIGAGPALFYATMDPTLTIFPHTLGQPGGTGTLTQPNALVTHMGSASDVTIGVEVEPGIRYMLTKCISVDLSFKYRYANPSFGFNFTEPFSGNANSVKFSPDLNLYSAQIGIAYHFD
jgi:hypothetical protein